MSEKIKHPLGSANHPAYKQPRSVAKIPKSVVTMASNFKTGKTDRFFLRLMSVAISQAESKQRAALRAINRDSSGE